MQRAALAWLGSALLHGALVLVVRPAAGPRHVDPLFDVIPIAVSVLPNEPPPVVIAATTPEDPPATSPAVLPKSLPRSAAAHAAPPESPPGAAEEPAPAPAAAGSENTYSIQLRESGAQAGSASAAPGGGATSGNGPGTASGNGAERGDGSPASPGSGTTGGPAAKAPGADQAARAAYFTTVHAAIRRRVTYPSRARRMGWEGRVWVAFTVSPTGEVSGVRVSGSSGQPVLDESAVEAVRRAAPLPAPRATQELVVPVTYSLSE